jgi:hypothetical protein
LSISVRLRNLIRGGQGPIWAGAPLEEEEEEEEDMKFTQCDYYNGHCPLSGI